MKKIIKSLPVIITIVLSWSFALWFIHGIFSANKLDLLKYIGSSYLGLIKVFIIICIAFIVSAGLGAIGMWIMDLPEKLKLSKWEMVIFNIIALFMISSTLIVIYKIIDNASL